MNASRHSNRGGQPSQRGRGRGGRRTGGFNDRRDLHPVPSIQQVIPGAAVSIVLKIDQGSGREIQGTAADILTSGNHPRGIKVRLQDGRVGRVQRMVSEHEAKAASAGLNGLGRNGESERGGGQVTVSARATPMPSRYSDFRLDAPDEPPAAELSLSDYVVVKTKPAKKGKGKKKNEATDGRNGEAEAEAGLTVESSTSKCPVCGEFEGDEVAVAHHVNEHFD
ncbi:hypothetical protein HYALB_00004018 [Hymenoscyphus albidus]|uniref:Uncharacterized protein n=1 Tax=Hymenoscyphus albidus TaxID=595503 RepID=A0A9N9QD64_9HELO|nr:hypothetical protein HYALB_00004018 [Hymenoscyphus albidus]